MPLSAEYREQYWAETVAPVQPERLIPVHWDALTGPLDGPLTGQVRIGGLLAPGEENTLACLKEKEAANPAISFATLPRFAPVLLFEGEAP